VIDSSSVSRAESASGLIRVNKKTVPSEDLMYLAKLYDTAAREHRVRYAIASILRDRVANEGAFKICFEMGDEEAVIRTILRRGLKNLKVRAALERSHLINLTHWLACYPDLAEAYSEDIGRTSPREASRIDSSRTS
jgi:hypothetical protein